ncbi:Electron transfer flavoprotein, beta subunit [Olavius sp. associated proteobacterium Delta 1]|nr:Electron transfer flavoprotein, beta subunit [Olavius sp. associated proteobacterium Delta 1]
MKILVCIKQVPESESPILIDNGNSWIQSDEIREFKMNRLDEFALEEAVLIKEAFSETRIDALSAGPDRAAEVIRRSIGMGADAGIHISTGAEGYHSSFEIAAWIAEYARGKPYDLILTGAMSEDNMQGQVGPMIAKRLSLPCATAVVFENIASDGKTIYVEREIEGGQRDTLELPLPAVLTIQSGINTPRYPSLSNLLRANKQGLNRIKAADPAPLASRENLVQLVYPHKTRAGRILTGSGEEKAAQLIQIFREKTMLI